MTKPYASERQRPTYNGHPWYPEGQTKTLTKRITDWAEASVIHYIALMLAGGVSFVGLIVLPSVTALEAYSCSQVSDQTGYPTDYRIPTGCYIDSGDGYVPYDRWINARVYGAE